MSLINRVIFQRCIGRAKDEGGMVVAHSGVGIQLALGSALVVVVVLVIKRSRIWSRDVACGQAHALMMGYAPANIG